MNIDNLSLAQVMEEEIELIPLMSKDEESKLNKQDISSVLPILSLRNTVLFPGVVAPITAGRDKSIQLLTQAYKEDRIIGVLSQKEIAVEDPTQDDLYTVGTVAKIMRMIKLPDGNITVILQGMKRFKVKEFVSDDPYFKAEVEILTEKVPTSRNKEYPIIIESIRDLAFQIVEENPMLPSEAAGAIKSIESNTFLINFVASNLTLSLDEKQLLLEISDMKLRAMEVMRFMNVELQKLELKNTIQNKVRKELDQQ
ncbi:MAG TPA: endopeptidase La, partial [Flavobacteriaceae bacterium]|nr:endopeptidase La [Flavobacteriaceae bacterium]